MRVVLEALPGVRDADGSEKLRGPGRGLRLRDLVVHPNGLDELVAQGKIAGVAETLENVGGVVTKRTQREHIIDELVKTERTYVQHLELLQEFKKLVEEKGVISGDQVHDIFLNLNALLDFQRRFGATRGAVLDGRDIGTVVFPHAEVKLFVTASPAERARRRHAEMLARGQSATLAEVEAEMATRDSRDAGRDVAPMVPAPDAVVRLSDG